MQSGFSRIGIAAAFMTVLLGAQAARAQHVVTEAEASKLTLEALTATPPPPRPVYRAYYRPAMSVRTVHGRAVRGRYIAAAYHPAGRHPAAHAWSHHRRR